MRLVAGRLSRTSFSLRGEALKPRLGLLTLIDRPWQFISP